MVQNKFIYIFLLLLIILPSSFSEQSNNKPTEVYVGIYLNQIYALSLKENQFSVDFYIWFRWKDKEINPLESFELANGKIDTKENAGEAIIKDFRYGSCRIHATIFQFWDISDFPLDDHSLRIEIEDSMNDVSYLIYIPDKENCSYSQDLKIPGWNAADIEANTINHTYKTNWGDLSLPKDYKSDYSRFIYSVNIKRPDFGYFMKMFFTVFVATLIALISLFIKPSDIDSRFGLSAGALFAAVASEVVIASSLPDTNIITLTDKLHIIAILFILISIAETIISMRFYQSEKSSLSHIFDRFCFMLLLISYLGLTSFIIIFR